MSREHQLEVVFFAGRHTGAVLGGALGPPRLSALHGGGAAAGSWDEGRGAWGWDEQRPGRYLLELDAPGFRPLRRPIQVHFGSTRRAIAVEPAEPARSVWDDFVAIFPSRGAYDPVTGALSQNLLAAVDALEIVTLPADALPAPAARERMAALWVSGSVPKRIAAGWIPPALPGGVLVRPWRGGELSPVRSIPLRALAESPLVRAAGRVERFSAAGLLASLESGRVSVQPEVDDARARRILESAGLRIVGRVLLGSGFYRVRAMDLDLAIRPLLVALLDKEGVCSAEPEGARVVGSDALSADDFLWPTNWDRRVAGVDRAWARLDAAGLEGFGGPELLAGIIDGGIKTYQQAVEHPDFAGAVSNGSPKIAALYDFRASYRSPDNDTQPDPHGTKVAGVLAAAAAPASSPGVPTEGGRGAAPGIRLLSGICDTTEDYEVVVCFLWSAGLGGRVPELLEAWFDGELPDYQADPIGFPALPVLGEDVDLICSARTFGLGGAKALAEALLDLLSRRSRSGRGAGFFLSAGNITAVASPGAPGTGTISSERGFAAHPRTFACGASSLDSGCQEIRAEYSGYGPELEWCAPSSSVASGSWDPPKTWMVWTSMEMDRGLVISKPLAETRLRSAAAAGDTSLKIEAILSLVAGTPILVGEPDWPGEWCQVSGLVGAGSVTLEKPLRSARPVDTPATCGLSVSTLSAAAHAGDIVLTLADNTGFSASAWLRIGRSAPVGELALSGPSPAVAPAQPEAPLAAGLSETWNVHTPVCSGIQILTRLSAAIGNSTYAQTIAVDDVSVLSVGDHLRIEKSGTPGAYDNVTVKSVDLVNNTFDVLGNEWATKHSKGDAVYRTGLHAVDNFGGTSAAAPLAAGVGALVLTARPRLTWVELRQLLRDSAARIVLTAASHWVDASGVATVSAADADFSAYLGHGRLDAGRAVEAALSYTTDDERDLYLRSTVADAGVLATAAADSPDIWIRNTDPAVDATPLVDEAPSAIGSSWIYLRVRNRGARESLDAWARIYVAARLPGDAHYLWPEGFDTNNLGMLSAVAWERGAYFIGELQLASIPGADAVSGAPGHADVYLEWPESLKPPALCTDGAPFRGRILVEINPFDGPLDGVTVLNNNNLSRKLLPTTLDTDPPTVSYEDYASGAALASSVGHPGVGRLSERFTIRVTDPLGIDVDGMRVRFRLSYRDRPDTNHTLRLSGGAWSLDAGSPELSLFAAPHSIEPSTGLTVPAAGVVSSALVTFELTADGSVRQLVIETAASDQAGNTSGGAAASHLIRVVVPVDLMLVLDGSGSMLTADAGVERWGAAAGAAEMTRDLFRATSELLSLSDRIGAVRFASQFGLGDQTATLSPAAPTILGPLLPADWAPQGPWMTNIGRGLQAAAGQLTGFGGQWRRRVALLLTDGRENTSPLLATVRDQAAGNPDRVLSIETDPEGLTIHACAFGAVAGAPDLQDLVGDYRGILHEASTGAGALEQLQGALLDMLVDAVDVEKLTGTAVAGGFFLSIEDRVEAAVFVLNDRRGFALTDPSGAPAAGAVSTGAEHSWVTITDPAPGAWTLTPTAGGDSAVALVDLQLRARFTASGPAVGQPLALRALITESGQPLSGARVVADIRGPARPLGPGLAALAASSSFDLGLLKPLTARVDLSAVRPRDRLEDAFFETHPRSFSGGEHPLTELGAGRYGLDWPGAVHEGVYRVRFRAAGQTASGARFVRDYGLAVHVASIPAADTSALVWARAASGWLGTLQLRDAVGNDLGPGLIDRLQVTAAGHPLSIEYDRQGRYTLRWPHPKPPGALSVRGFGQEIVLVGAAAG